MSPEGLIVPPKQLSNPFSTGGGGPNFENQVQSLFVTLMLTGGVLPCLPPWPIKRIKLQGRNQNYNTDDFIAFIEDRSTGRQAKLLAQIKHKIRFSENDATFGDVIKAAWDDFNNANLFDRTIDALAVITGPLSTEDIDGARVILDWAGHLPTAQELIENIQLAKFSSDSKRKALASFRGQLKNANDGVDVADESLWQFMKCFHVLSYDMDVRSGVTLSLAQSHIAQFTTDNASGVWGMVSKEVASFNQNAGTITLETISEPVRSAFSRRIEKEYILKEDSEAGQESPAVTYTVDQANALALASLVGQWDENSAGDRDEVRKLIQGHDQERSRLDLYNP